MPAPSRTGASDTREIGMLVYDGAPERVILLGKDKARFSADIAATEERWLMLSEELEAAERA